MKVFKNVADELIDMFDMYGESIRDWTLVCSWLCLAVSFLTGSGVFAVIAMWHEYGPASLILDAVIGIPAVALFACLAVTYGYIAYRLSNATEDEEETDYYD